MLSWGKNLKGFPGSLAGKESACNEGDPLGGSLGQEDALETGWAAHSSLLGLPWWLRP